MKNDEKHTEEYLGDISQLDFLNIYSKIQANETDLITQLIKFREEFYEFMAEIFNTDDSKKELLHCIQAGVNLFHAMENNKINIYNEHIKYMNKKTLDGYDWLKRKDYGTYYFEEQNASK